MSTSISLTSWEIFTNPKDLFISIGNIEEDLRFCFELRRGPGHNYKLLVSSKPFEEKVEDVAIRIRLFLQGIYQDALKELAEGDSLSVSIINPDNQEIDESRILNLDLIDRIYSSLRLSNVASTWKISTKFAVGAQKNKSMLRDRNRELIGKQWKVRKRRREEFERRGFPHIGHMYSVMVEELDIKNPNLQEFVELFNWYIKNSDIKEAKCVKDADSRLDVFTANVFNECIRREWDDTSRETLDKVISELFLGQG